MHFIIALLVGTLYFKIGQDANYALDNCNLLFFGIMFLMFNAFSATLITCKLQENIIFWILKQVLLLILLIFIRPLLMSCIFIQKLIKYNTNLNV